jgi:hypothetical protein
MKKPWIMAVGLLLIMAGRPAAQSPRVTHVIVISGMDAIGGNPEVEFALSGLKGTAFGNAFTGEAVTPAHGGQHGYFPDFYEIRTGFVACGPGVKKGGVIREMNEQDIAPTVASLLRLNFPSAVGKASAVLFGR